MMKGLLLAAGCAVSTANTASLFAESTDRVIRIKPFDAQILSDEVIDKTKGLLGELDVWGETPDGSIEVRMPENMVHVFSDVLGFRIEDSTEEHLEHQRWFDENRANQMCENSSCGASQTRDEFYSQYQGVRAINDRVRDIAGGNADIVTPKVWGQTYEGNDQYGVVISAPSNEEKPVVFYFCGEHAREWIPPMFCTYMIENLVSEYRAGNDEVVRLMDQVEFHVLPVMNVDGYEFSRTPFNNFWRKSRKPNTNSGCIGTDLNRNYAFRWNNGGSSSNPCSDTFHGATPFDNVEVDNLKRYAEELNGRMIVQTDVHAFGQMWMFPWGWTRDLPPDMENQQASADATRDAIRAVNGLNFATGPISRVIYVASGSSCDWFYGEHGVKYAFAPEVRGTSFQPAASNIAPSNDELWAGMLAQVNYAIENP
jgi:hypothetical protein